MSSILNWYVEEGMIFCGSGRASTCVDHPLVPSTGHGGEASGPVSFMRGGRICGDDQIEGKTRRAAKMVVLNIDHPGRPRLHLV